MNRGIVPTLRGLEACATVQEYFVNCTSNVRVLRCVIVCSASRLFNIPGERLGHLAAPAILSSWSALVGKLPTTLATTDYCINYSQRSHCCMGMCNYHLYFLSIYRCRIYCFLLMYLLCTVGDTNCNIPESQSQSTRQLRHSLSLLGVGFWFPVLHLKRSLGLCLTPPISCLSSPFPCPPQKH